MKSEFSILSGDSELPVSPVSQIKEQIDRLLEIIARQEADLREARIMLQRANTEVILYGKQPPPDDTANLGLFFETASFLVVSLELLDRSQLFRQSGSGRFSPHEVELMKTAIYNVFETVLGPLCIASCCESDVAFANILINLLDEEQPEDVVSSGIEKALTSASDIVRRNYGLALTFAMSPIVHGHQALPHARLASYQVLQRKLAIEKIDHTNLVLSPESVPAAITPPPNVRLEKQYYQFVLSRDFDLAQKTLRELTEQDLRTEGISFEIVKLRFLNHVESLLNTAGIAASEVGYLYLRDLSSEAELFRLLDDLFSDIPRHIAQDLTARKEKINDAANYITEHYAEPDLCLAKLCDMFRMSQSYLSRTFKSTCGMGVLEYIHSQRMIHVKELLKDPANSIDSIWAAAGYTNRRTFNRVFRKLEGMSASEYRKKTAKAGQ